MDDMPTREQMWAAIQLAEADELFFGRSSETGGRWGAYPFLLCGDTFNYGGDAEPLSWSEVPAVWNMYSTAPNSTEGAKRLVRFIAKRRGCEPIDPVIAWLES